MKRYIPLFLLVFLFCGATGFAQTTLISPTGDGGFENGTTFSANGWTLVNHTTNKWTIGATPSSAGAAGAYITNDSGVTNSNNYTITSAQVSHFYRDISFPGGETSVFLSFKFKGVGESTFDHLRVYLVSTATTPVAGTEQLAANNIGGTAWATNINLHSNWTYIGIRLPVAVAGTTQRLVFSWKNDNSGGVTPAMAIDEIKLVSQTPSALAGAYTIDNTTETTGSNFKYFTDAVMRLNADGISGAVTFNVSAGQTFREVIPADSATGTALNTITFQKSGGGANPIITQEGFSVTTDYIFQLVGGDYTTFDGIDFIGVAPQATGNTTGVSYGINVTNKSATDGAMYNTIKNCNFNLNNSGTTASTSSICIRFIDVTAPSGAAGANSDNLIKNVSCQKAYRSIYISGGSATNRGSGNVVTADGGYTSPIAGATAGYNDLGNASISQSSGMRAVEVLGQVLCTVEKCEVRNFTNTSTTATNDLVALMVNSTYASRSITFTKNLLHDISSSSTGTQVVYGIWLTGACVDTMNITKNAVYSIAGATTSTGSTRGILYNNSKSAAVGNIVNNFIYKLTSPDNSNSSANSPGIRGIELNSAINVNLYNNTVYLDASSNGAATHFQTACLYMSSSTSTVLDMKNNILVNKSTTTPSGTQTRATSFYKTTGTIGTQITSTTNNNLLYAGTPGAKNLLYYPGTAGLGAQDLTTYRSNSTSGINNGDAGVPRETNAKTENVPFVSTSGTYNLHINPSSPTIVEANGTPIAAVTDDYDGDARDGSTPDIGADEGSFTPVYNEDVSPVAFIAPTSGSTYVVGTSFEPQASFTNSGLANQADVPVRFQVIGPSPSTSVVLNITQTVASLPSGGSANATFDSTGTGTLAAGTYTMKAISELGSDEFMTNDTITGTFSVAAPLAGDYLVGSAQTAPFNTITGAVGRLNGVGVSAAVRFLLDDNTYGSETYPITIDTIKGGSSTNTFTLKPNTGKTPILTGSAASLFTVNKADYVVFDGSNADGGTSKDLTLRNTSTSGTVFTLQNEATNDTLKNMVLEGAITTSTSGVVLFSTSASNGNSNNVVKNNTIRDRSDAAGVPANLVYSSSTANGNLAFTNNTLFNFTTGGINLANAGDNVTLSGNAVYQTASRTTAFYGLRIAAGNAHTVSNNSIGGAAADRSGTAMTSTGAITGISLTAGTVSASNVDGNTVANFFSDHSTGIAKGIEVTAGTVNIGVNTGNTIGGGASAWDTVRVGYDFEGIKYAGSTSCTIKNNTVGNLGYWDASNDRQFAIYATGGTVTIENNTVRDFKSNSTGTTLSLTSYNPGGILVSTTTNGNIIRGNTVYNLQHLNTGVVPYSMFALGFAAGSDYAANVIEKNKVYGLSSVGTGTGFNAPKLGGALITISGVTLANNMFALGTETTADAQLFGIKDTNVTATRTNRIYYNTIVLSGAVGTGAANSTAFSRASTTNPSTDSLYNNIFINNRTGGTGKHLAVHTASATGWTAGSANNNLLYASDNTAVGNLAGTNYSFTGWKTTALSDAYSVSAPVDFISATDLHVDGTTANAWNVNGLGKALAGFVDDYNATSVRSELMINGMTDIGADEFTPGSPLPNATESGTIADASTTTYTFAGKTVGSILWHGATLPTSVTFTYNAAAKANDGSDRPRGFGYWEVTATGGSGYTYDITFNYDPSALANISSESNVRLAKSENSGTTWQQFDVTGTDPLQTDLNTTAKTVTVRGLSSFSQFTLGDFSSPLPVELSAFTATSKGRDIQLAWETKTEVNTAKFEIERAAATNESTPEWAKIGEVNAAGNSNAPVSYSFTDKKLNTGTYQYRLRMVDVDGTTDYSSVINSEISAPKEYALSQNYPNPFNPSTRVDYQLPFDARVSVELYSVTGQKVASLVNELQQAGYYTLNVNVQSLGLASGVYIYRMIARDNAKSENFVQTKKMVVLK